VNDSNARRNDSVVRLMPGFDHSPGRAPSEKMWRISVSLVAFSHEADLVQPPTLPAMHLPTRCLAVPALPPQPARRRGPAGRGGLDISNRDRQAPVVWCYPSRGRCERSAPDRWPHEQSRREFVPTDTPMGPIVDSVKATGTGPAAPLCPRCRLQQFQRPATPDFPTDSSDLAWPRLRPMAGRGPSGMTKPATVGFMSAGPEFVAKPQEGRR